MPNGKILIVDDDKNICELLRLYIEKEGYEADDIIGTVSRICEEKEIECSILTGDKDDLQLASDFVKVKLVVTRMGSTTTTVYDGVEVKNKFGVTPQEYIDVKGLMGDPSDNIPGVAGIGEEEEAARGIGEGDGLAAQIGYGCGVVDFDGGVDVGVEGVGNVFKGGRANRSNKSNRSYNRSQGEGGAHGE